MDQAEVVEETETAVASHSLAHRLVAHEMAAAIKFPIILFQ